MEAKPVQEGTLLWKPSEDLIRGANITRYIKWLKETRGVTFSDYDELWRWSVSRLEEFWMSVWDFFDIQASSPFTRVLEGAMPSARWFQGAHLNYAEHVFRNRTQDHPAVIYQSEIRPRTVLTWDELYTKTASVARTLRELGVGRGDRVVAFLPNIPETLIAFLATASIGAVWSSCSPDFGTRSVIDRFKQIEPKVLFAVDGYRYGGKTFERLEAVAVLQNALDTLDRLVVVPYLEGEAPANRYQRLWDYLLWQDMLARPAELTFQQVPFDHPLWVVYSSGTTGLPKGLVHGHGGILIEFMKFLGLHLDLHPGDPFFWFSTTGWVMWNIVQGGLLMGATPILYDGSPGFPDMDVLWQLA